MIDKNNIFSILSALLHFVLLWSHSSNEKNDSKSEQDKKNKSKNISNEELQPVLADIAAIFSRADEANYTKTVLEAMKDDLGLKSVKMKFAEMDQVLTVLPKCLKDWQMGQVIVTLYQMQMDKGKNNLVLAYLYKTSEEKKLFGADKEDALAEHLRSACLGLHLCDENQPEKKVLTRFGTFLDDVLTPILDPLNNWIQEVMDTLNSWNQQYKTSKHDRQDRIKNGVNQIFNTVNSFILRCVVCSVTVFMVILFLFYYGIIINTYSVLSVGWTILLSIALIPSITYGMYWIFTRRRTKRT